METFSANCISNKKYECIMCYSKTYTSYIYNNLKTIFNISISC